MRSRTSNLPDWIEYSMNPRQNFLVEDIYNNVRFISVSVGVRDGIASCKAMARGCVLVATNIGGVKDYAEDGVTGLLFPIRDPVALARNLVKVIKTIVLDWSYPKLVIGIFKNSPGIRRLVGSKSGLSLKR